MKMLNALVVATLFLFSSFPVGALADGDMYGDIDMYDDQGNYYYGDVDRSGNIDMYDQDGKLLLW
jgi:hypothetical protein